MNDLELMHLIDELRALPKENEWVEFKSGTATTNERLGQYFSAISNAACIANQPFGYLVFNIDDVSHLVIGKSFKFKNVKEGKRADFENLLNDKLPELITNRQKRDKVKNLLQAMKHDSVIYLNGQTWRLNAE